MSGPAHGIAPRVFLCAGLLMISLAAATFAIGGGRHTFEQKPLDLNINLVAAHRLVHREPLYDRSASRRQAIELGGTAMKGSYRTPTNSFPGPPTTALIHTPFLLFSYETSVLVFRVVALVGMIGAVWIAAAALPSGARLAGGVFGTGALLLSAATLGTLQLGQGHEFVMLGFALAIWGTATGRWKVVGIGLGLATVLKLSPGIILLYLVVRGRRQVLSAAVATMAALCALAAIVGRPGDLIVWLRDVMPGISGGTTRLINQSLPALVARSFSSQLNLNRHGELGSFRFVAFPIVIFGLYGLWRWSRNQPVDPMEIGILIVLALLAGPLSWNHYTAWAVLPLVLVADPRRWVGLTRPATAGVGLALGLVLMMLASPLAVPEVDAVRANWHLRVSSSSYVLAEMLLLAILVTLLRLTGPVDPPPEKPPMVAVSTDRVSV